MSKLTYQQRQRLPASQFALRRERKYPIEDKAHARAALARVSRFGTPAQKMEVRRKVHSKFPDIKQERLRA